MHYCIMSYVERVERHFEVEFDEFRPFVDVRLLDAEKDDVWNAEQRNQNQRRLGQFPVSFMAEEKRNASPTTTRYR